MALPQFWMGMNRKDLAERALVTKREHEAQRSQRRESAAKYHRDLNLLSSQYKNLENPSGRTTRVNYESRRDEELRAKRREALYQRQQKLTLLLAKENEQYFVELKALTDEKNGKDPWNTTKLKEQIEELKRRRKEDEEALRKSSMHHMFHESKLPYLKEYEAKLLEKEVLDSWEQKKKHIQEQVSVKHAEDRKRREELKQMLHKAEQEAGVYKAERTNLLEKWKESLKAMVNDIESNRLKVEKLKFDLDVLEKYEKMIEGVQTKCNEIKSIQQQRIERIANFRPSKEKVRKLATEVRHRYNVDLTSLNFLINVMNGKEKGEHDICLDDITSAKESVTEKLAKEDARSADLQLLFEEEAARLWTSNKKMWDEEMKSHDDLMAQVLESLVVQIQDKKKECIENQKSLLDSQEKLLDELSFQKQKSEDDVQLLLEKEQFFLSQVQELGDKLKKFDASMTMLRNT